MPVGADAPRTGPVSGFAGSRVVDIFRSGVGGGWRDIGLFVGASRRLVSSTLYPRRRLTGTATPSWDRIIVRRPPRALIGPKRLPFSIASLTLVQRPSYHAQQAQQAGSPGHHPEQPRALSSGPPSLPRRRRRQRRGSGRRGWAFPTRAMGSPRWDFLHGSPPVRDAWGPGGPQAAAEKWLADHFGRLPRQRLGESSCGNRTRALKISKD